MGVKATPDPSIRRGTECKCQVLVLTIAPPYGVELDASACNNDSPSLWRGGGGLLLTEGSLHRGVWILFLMVFLFDDPISIGCLLLVEQDFCTVLL